MGTFSCSVLIPNSGGYNTAGTRMSVVSCHDGDLGSRTTALLKTTHHRRCAISDFSDAPTTNTIPNDPMLWQLIRSLGTSTPIPHDADAGVVYTTARHLIWEEHEDKHGTYSMCHHIELVVSSRHKGVYIIKCHDNRSWEFTNLGDALNWRERLTEENGDV